MFYKRTFYSSFSVISLVYVTRMSSITQLPVALEEN